MSVVIRFVTCRVRDEHRSEYLDIQHRVKECTANHSFFSGFYLLEDRVERGRFRECFEYKDEKSFRAADHDSSMEEELGPLIDRLRQIVPLEDVEVETFVQSI